ncbi:hypothetical protein QTP88_009054 [Uroleucon formosanum]
MNKNGTAKIQFYSSAQCMVVCGCAHVIKSSYMMYIEAASDNVWMINAFSEHERDDGVRSAVVEGKRSGDTDEKACCRFQIEVSVPELVSNWSKSPPENVLSSSFVQFVYKPKMDIP